jgi:hypothetical protein
MSPLAFTYQAQPMPSTEMARRIPHWEPRPSQDAVAAAADTVERHLITP